MGVYSIVYVSCPRCDDVLELQAGGDYDSYQSNDVPALMAASLDGDTVWCHRCNRPWRVVTSVRTVHRIDLRRDD